MNKIISLTPIRKELVNSSFVEYQSEIGIIIPLKSGISMTRLVIFFLQEMIIGVFTFQYCPFSLNSPQLHLISPYSCFILVQVKSSRFSGEKVLNINTL